MRVLVCVGICMATLLGTLGWAQQADLTRADVLLHGGKIYTVNPKQPWAEALLIRGDRILAVGKLSELESHTGPTTKRIDLKGGMALPGFIEGHGHLLGLGNVKRNLWLGETTSWDEVVMEVAAAVKQAAPGDWILGRGWHQEKWTKAPSRTIRGFPTHHALSKASPNNPVILAHASGHAIFANAKAMEIAGVTTASKAPAGGEILRDDQGKAIGLFNETAESMITAAYDQSLAGRTAQEKKAHQHKIIKLAVDECLRHGITSFQDAGSSFSDIATFRELAAKGNLPIRLWVMIGETNDELVKGLPGALVRDFANHHLTVGGIKRYVDGALGSRGAWLLKPYSDLPSSHGQNVTSIADLRQTARLALEHNLQLCTHAIGDRGNREMLDLYASVLDDKDRRWRIEHAQHLHPTDIPRFAKLKVIASMQGIHCTSDAPFVVKRLGEKRAREGAYVWKPLLEAGVKIANGTDTPVEGVDPLPNIAAMVSRKTKAGKTFFPEHKLTMAQAIETYTINNAFAVFQESQKGSLVPGKLADITLLSEDLFKAQDLAKVKVWMTMVGGKVRYVHPENR